MNVKRMLGVLVMLMLAFTSMAQQGQKRHKGERHFEARVDTFAMENNLSPEKTEELKKTISEFRSKRKALKAEENTTKEDWKALRNERQEAIKAVLGDDELYEKWQSAHKKERKKQRRHQHRHQKKGKK